ncbi:YbaN family protein [Chelatococcus sp. SYSU_G07232]|uniref:YbaN family protein n=2 Tax=Chelatococcus albus TaxID=3047466 RepID=A0ABT7ABZ0_9HYPH|nr:YbaN family protein [Chelatococcus sp. SYSU_G07232]
MIDEPPIPHPSTRRPGWQRTLYATAGWLCVAIGIIGLFLPLLPGTVFLILAAACFTRSSARFEIWLLAHPTLGPSVRAWRATGAIPRRAKWLACASLLVSYAFVWLSGAPSIGLAGAAATMLAVAGYIISRPEPAPRP